EAAAVGGGVLHRPGHPGGEVAAAELAEAHGRRGDGARADRVDALQLAEVRAQRRRQPDHVSRRGRGTATPGRGRPAPAAGPRRGAPPTRTRPAGRPTTRPARRGTRARRALPTTSSPARTGTPSG